MKDAIICISVFLVTIGGLGKWLARGLQKSIDEVRDSVKDVRQDVKDVRKEVQDVRQDVKDVRKEVQDVRQDVKDLSVIVYQNRHSICVLSEKVSHLSTLVKGRNNGQKKKRNKLPKPTTCGQ